MIEIFTSFNACNTPNFLLILFILSYFIPLVYGLYKPIITSKYIIFVLIPIIVLISVLVNELKIKFLKNFFISLIVLITIGNQFTEQNFKQFFESRKHFKPQYDLALKYINESNYKNFYVDLNFAKTVEPLNKNIISRYNEVEELRKIDLPSLPTTLELELKVNPFLRCEEKDLKESIKDKINVKNNSKEVFQVLREWKDNF